MPKSNWEAKPPITRSDLFADGIEIGEIFADNDERAIAWLEKTFAKHNIGNPLAMKISCGNKAVRTIKN